MPMKLFRIQETSLILLRVHHMSYELDGLELIIDCISTGTTIISTLQNPFSLIFFSFKEW